ncbi:MAG: hypothetical protein P9E24_07690, partial [Candidatus Competibacter sp.]|nr:hypothetical protein [Candidatus Competibacter sp.]MDG4584812.1 hypothetical protein [Candidatus Competibacter sp.]
PNCPGLNPFFIRARIQSLRRQKSFPNNRLHMGLTENPLFEKLSFLPWRNDVVNPQNSVKKRFKQQQA